MQKKCLWIIVLLLSFVSSLAAQAQSIRGVVYDDQNEPAIGATVRLKSDPKVGAQTGLDGDFVIKAKEGDILIISYIGFKTQEVKAKDGMKVVLESDAEVLQEVVAMGYGSGRAINTTTASVVKINSKELASKPNANVLESLQGKVAGLSVSSGSGDPGTQSTVELHGSGSLGLGSAPLYILDGMPVGQGSIMGLNPNDFESVQVFKDASATAIYGSRAANGVIFITTKRGGSTDERATVTVTTQYGISNLASRRFYDQVMTADELAAFWEETGIQGKEAIENFRSFGGNTNWTDFMFRKAAPMYNASVAISGGAGSTRYYLSGQHYYQEGLYRGGTKYTKSNLRANLSTKVNDWLSISLNNGIYYDVTVGSFTGSNYKDEGGFWRLNPFFKPTDKDGNYYWAEKIPGANFYDPKYYSALNKGSHGTFEYLGNLALTLRPIEGLTLRSTISADIDYYNYLFIRDPRYAGKPKNGKRSDESSKGFQWTFTNTAEYSYTPADGHDLTFLLGHEYNRWDGDGFNAEGWGLSDYRLMHLDKVTDNEKKDIGSWKTQTAYLSFFGRLSYSLMDRYHFDVSLRNDASSKFPPRHRNALFWSAGFKWNAKQEAFLRDISWINSLDGKISTGTSGNSALGNYAYFATIGTSTPYRNEVSFAILDPGNPDLTWEHQQKTTIGFDGRFFGRLGVNFETYYRLTTQMVMDVPYPYTTGISSNTRNVGSYRNAGFDLRIDYDIWKGRQGDYLSLYANMNYNRDKVLSLFQGLTHWCIPKTHVFYIVGQPLMYGLPIFKQVNPETGDPEWYLPGEDKSQMRRDDSAIATGKEFNHEALEQNTGIMRNTPVRGGFGLNGQYKGFFASVDFSFFLGKHMISNDLYFGNNPKVFPGDNVLRSTRNYWKKPGDVVPFPDIKRYKTLLEYIDTRMLCNSSYMRLKALTVGYELPQSYLSGQEILRGVKISLTGRNLLTFTKFQGPDPEPDTNVALGRNPSTRQFVGSLELTF